ncbi:MAG: DegT/DnrJ/EryC1/StrS family aminotransferase, partial [Deltaproteobacteria bacterium]|nr:DegT/DnrJ/EryC1/StrS family aminotransferase [Deltaproteobacteria bacterium]
AIDQFGVPARHEELAQAAAVRGTTPLFLEDAACALGSALGGRPCGSFGVVSIISFHPRKVITTGEGGMCLTDDGDLAERIRQSRNHGLDHKGRFVVARGNARMTEIQAAIGLAQLAKLEKIVARRREIAAHYRARLSDLPLSFQSAPDSAQRNEQSFGCVLHFGGESTRNRIIASARSMGVELGPLSHHLGVLPSLAPFGPHRPTPISANVAQRGFALPIHSRLSDEEVETVIRTVRRCIEEVVSDGS